MWDIKKHSMGVMLVKDNRTSEIVYRIECTKSCQECTEVCVVMRQWWRKADTLVENI